MHRQVALTSSIVQIFLITAAVADPAGPSGGPDAGALSAQQAGAHYGQALGTVDVCPGAKMTDAGRTLEKAYPGATRESFLASAAKVYQAWQKVRRCSDTLDPNPCKIIIDQSCAAAAAEIGPHGSVLPGLVDFGSP